MINHATLRERDAATRGLRLGNVHLIETRVLVRRANGWQALPYVWNAAQTEAELSRTGDTVPLELVAEDGTPEAFTYVVPNENQCAGCHVVDLNSKAIAPIGTKARHLNRSFEYASGTDNQLPALEQGRVSSPVLPELSGVARNADWRNVSEPVAARARAYLDVNCGHCHNARGPANTHGLGSDDIRRRRNGHLGVCKPPVAGRSRHRRSFLRCGARQSKDSILAYRLLSNEPGVMMPEQGRSTTHREGVALIEQWIASLPGNCQS